MKIIDEYSHFQLIGFSLADKWGVGNVCKTYAVTMDVAMSEDEIWSLKHKRAVRPALQH
jgi:hypothetical protein